MDGVSSAFPPEDLPPTQLAWGTNIVVRGGRPSTRPGIDQLGYLPSGRFQGIGYFSQADGMLVASIAGRLYRITFGASGSFTVLNIPLAMDNSPTLRRAYFCETPSALIVQDGQSDAIIYDGAKARRSKWRKSEVPTGTHMAFGNGRLWLCVYGRELIAGDIATTPGSELLFTEAGFLLGGGRMAFPKDITALAFMTQIDTTTGYGALMAFARGITHSIHAEVTARDRWATTDGFTTVVFPEIGAAGGVCTVNQDLYWRGGDGAIRTLRQAVTDLSSPGNASVSEEVGRLLDYDSPDLLERCSSIYFGNRVLMTAAPRYDATGNVVFDRIVSLDCRPLATMRGKALPAYDGEWTGIGARQIISGTFNGQTRAFAVLCDSEGRNVLAEITERADADTRIVANNRNASPVLASMESRAFSFGDPERFKRLERLDLFASDIRGRVWVWVYFRADDEQEWTAWDDFWFTAEMTDSSTAEPHVWTRKLPGYTVQQKTLTIPEEFGSSGMMKHVGCTFQVRLEWQGACRISRLRLMASPLAEQQYAGERDESGVPYVDQDSVEYRNRNQQPYLVTQ